MTTSVIVVCCRRHRWVVPALESVVDQADDVVVIDNGSPGPWLHDECRRLGVRWVRLERNVGFPAGVNAGLRVARGDIVGLLNDDAMVAPGWLKAAAEVLGDPTIGAVAPKLLFATPFARLAPADVARHFAGREAKTRCVTVSGADVVPLGPGRTLSGCVYVPLYEGASPDDIRIDGEPVGHADVVSLVNNAGSYLSDEGHSGDFGFETPDGPLFDKPADRFAACAAAMVVRAETFSMLGGFEPRFFAYYEDTDWCWRAQLAGLRIRYDPTVTVRHVGGASTGGPGNPAVPFLAARNRLHCLARNAPLDVVYRQLLRARMAEPCDRRLALVLARRVPLGLVERRGLARQWVHAPRDVFSRWAGCDQSWAHRAS